MRGGEGGRETREGRERREREERRGGEVMVKERGRRGGLLEKGGRHNNRGGCEKGCNVRG